VPYRIDIKTTVFSDSWSLANMKEVIDLIRDLVAKGAEIEFIHIGKVACKGDKT
jgi:hypothetical protein